jgi:hypothetical protein
VRGLLDEELLEGPQEVEVTFRPERFAFPVRADDIPAALARIGEACQVWGGASTPLIPLADDETIPVEYRRMLPGSAVDFVQGVDKLDIRPGASILPDLAPVRSPWFGRQFAAALLEYRRQETYAVLETVDLDDGDPWKPIYAACLGLLPQEPEPALLEAGSLGPDLRFEDFVRVEAIKTAGSLEDLLDRATNDRRITPRRLSMIHLAFGNSGSTGIRTKPTVLPDPGFARFDAGPNVIVVCSPGSLEDLALLWNLRAAHGDGRALPIGVPADETTPEAIRTLVSHPRISRHGLARRTAYVTSASIVDDDLRERLGPLLEGRRPQIALASLEEMLAFGWPGGWRRNEVLVWRGGRAQLTPLPADSNTEIFRRAGLSDNTRMSFDLTVAASPFPQALDVRIEVTNAMFAFGHRSSHGRPASSRTEVEVVEWPSRMLMARAIAGRRGLDLAESEPGRACRVLLEGLGDLSDVSLLAHAPLLDLLELMAARQGFGWFKERDRARGQEPDPTSAVALVSDDLPDRPFEHFKRVLGNNDAATKHWLLWAERAGLILKGFPLQCLACRARQWIPIVAFSPPIICRGCGRGMDTPFGERSSINFKYRLSERLRRVYEHDAMGHLLVARYFDLLLGEGQSGRLIGQHLGMEVRTAGSTLLAGEADVLLLTRVGEFVPVEVKRRGAGLTAGEVEKLDGLVEAFVAPWSAVAACEYLGQCKTDLGALQEADEAEGAYQRIVLAYDHLLDPRPFWSMGADPFSLSALTEEEINDRERRFVATLVDRATNSNESWFEADMLHRYEPPGAEPPPEDSPE